MNQMMLFPTNEMDNKESKEERAARFVREARAWAQRKGIQLKGKKKREASHGRTE